ncbi:MAG: LysM peptidoglycan-binding domain-containing protein [Anaerolineaceae bacterium]|nr:LysM peptidoglycan-binding domain-containing protein [Anaerolineaceae bacterium]
MSDLEDGNQEDTVKWIIRYVVIPVSLAVITGLFALEVINREIESRPVSGSELVNSVLATMTAAATHNPPNPPTPVVEPSSTPTAVPTATEEANLRETGETIADNPTATAIVLPPTAVCGQVPSGWRLYTVQPGNTLFSLARQTGTTVATIQQVNCLYDELKAYTQIWLPPFIAADVEPSPMPTPTATEQPALPDLIINTSDWPTISDSCDGDQYCTTTVNLAITNVGTAAASSFDVLVQLDPEQSMAITSFVEGLEVGATAVLTLHSPVTNSCYDPTCTVCLTADSRGSILESDETNNGYCQTFTRPGGGG